MAKLAPPLLEGTIPAFYKDLDSNNEGIVNITIPFSLNRSVSRSQIKGLALKIKTAQSSSYLYTKTVYDTNLFELEDSCQVSFVLNENDKNNGDEQSIIEKFKKGQFYKFQIAFIDFNNEVGYYSTVAVGKYTTKPILHINELNSHYLNMNDYLYNGYYSQEGGDSTERVYSYIFNVYDAQGNLFATSGEQLHNANNDSELYESKDEFILGKELEINQTYRIQYTVTTNNGLTVSSPKYRIMTKLSIDPEIKADLSTKLNYENGYIDINLVGHKDADGIETPATGAFLLSRSSSADNFQTWDEISRFKLAAQLPSRWIWRDCTVEHGQTYRYSLQQYNDAGLYSNRILAKDIYADFEYAFLYDGIRQLKIKYNPKMTNFKTDVLETKTDTIGGQHPFIFRNGRVYYHEFPISGLISRLMDEENLFLSEEEIGKYEYVTNLTSENLVKERTFKMKVLEWLTNGKPKLFRSPTEGNFIVRLMNTSLSPSDQVGRMLHTFSSTAYEVDEYNYQNLNKHGFINIDDPELAQMRWETIHLYDVYKSKLEDDTLGAEEQWVQINNHPVQTLRFNDMLPGDRFRVQFSSSVGAKREMRIGATGSYYIDTGVPMISVEVPMTSKFNSYGSLTYGYYSVLQNVFDKVAAVSVIEIPTEQYIGYHDIIQEIEYVYDEEKGWRKNPKLDIIEFFNIHVERREVEQVREIDKKYYRGRRSTAEIHKDNADPFSIYEICVWDSKNEADHYRPGYSNYDYEVIGYKDFYNNEKNYQANERQPFAMINNAQINVDDVRVYEWFRPGKIKSLVSGNGVFTQVSYQIRNIDYLIEEENPVVFEKKSAYEAAIQALNDHLDTLDTNVNNLSIDELIDKENNLRMNIQKTYQIYINTLIDEQLKEKEAEGLL